MSVTEPTAAMTDRSLARSSPMPETLDLRAAWDTGGTRSRALKAAAQILKEEGPAALTLGAIARRARTGISSLYYYFSCKDDLLISLAHNGFEELTGEMLDAATARTDVKAAQRVFAAYIAFSSENPPLFALMFDTELMARHVTLREAESRAFLTLQSCVERDPGFPTAQAAPVASALWAMGRGMAAIAQSQPGGRLTSIQATKIFGGATFLLNRA